MSPAFRLAAAAFGVLAVLAPPAHAAADDEIVFYGDSRLRFDGRNRSDGLLQARGRNRTRLGWRSQHAGGKFDWRVRVATAANDPISRNQTLVGKTGGEPYTGGLDELVFGLHPTDSLDILLGKLPMQSGWSASEMLFDGDLTVPGVMVDWDLPSDLGVYRDMNLRVGGYLIHGLFGSNTAPYLVAGQLRGKLGRGTLTLGGFYFQHLHQINFRTDSWTQMTNHFTNLGTDGDTVADFRQMVDNSLTAWRARIDWPLRLFGTDLTAGFEAILNSAASSRQLAFEARLDFPKVPFGKAYVLWRDVQQNAVLSAWADSDLGEGTGFHSGLEIGYSAPLEDWLTLDVSYYHFDRNQPLNTLAPRHTDRVFVDLTAKW